MSYAAMVTTRDGKEVLKDCLHSAGLTKVQRGYWANNDLLAWNLWVPSTSVAFYFLKEYQGWAEGAASERGAGPLVLLLTFQFGKYAYPLCTLDPRPIKWD